MSVARPRHLVVVDAEIVYDTTIDLTESDATGITDRIREWVNACPIDDIKAAYFGRIWLAMGYDSWAEWCDCELNGFKLPAIERREVVAELAGSGMSNTAISDVLDISKPTVARDLSGVTNVTPAEVTGQDGKTYTRPKPTQTQPKPESETTVIDGATIDAQTGEVIDDHQGPRRQKRPPVWEMAALLSRDVARLADKLETFSTDDRIGRDKTDVRNNIGWHLNRLNEVIAELTQKISESDQTGD